MNSSSPLPELPAIAFLASMDSSHRAFLASFGKFVRPAKGDTLIEQGAPQNHLYVVITGVLHVVFTGGGQQLPVATLGAGDSLGEVNLFDPSEASASVFARSECLIWSISAEEVAAFFEADPLAGIELMKGLLKLAAQRIRGMNEKLADAVGMAKALTALTYKS